MRNPPKRLRLLRACLPGVGRPFATPDHSGPGAIHFSGSHNGSATPVDGKFRFDSVAAMAHLVAMRRFPKYASVGVARTPTALDHSP